MANFFVRSRPTATRGASTAYTLGQKIVSTSASAFLGICFECTTAGTSAAGAEPAWNTTVGGTTTDGGVTWTTRGGAGIWIASKAYALGDRVVKTSQTTLTNASSVVWECTTAGTSGGSEPAWPTTVTAGTTTQTDSGVTWTARVASSWDNAHPFLAAMLKDVTNTTMRVVAGDTIYVSKGHSETTLPSSSTALSIKLPGTGTSPNKVICCDDTGQPSSPTAVAITAQIAVTAGNTTTWMELLGFGYWYGIKFVNNCASGAGNIYLAGASSVKSCHRFDSCTFQITSSTAVVHMTANASGSLLVSRTVCINCAFVFGNTGCVMMAGLGDFLIKGGSIGLTGTAPAGLFSTNTGILGAGLITLDGVDMSGMGSTKLFGGSGWEIASVRFQLINCKLGSGFVLTDSPTGNVGIGSVHFDIVNCDSGGTNYKLHRTTPFGNIDHETTKVMSGGASDGTTTVSHKLVSNTGTSWAFPLEGFDLVTWNDNSGSSKTATVEILTDSATALNNDDIWLDLAYLKDSADPLGGFGNNSKADILASNAAQATSSVTWTTTGITNVMKQKLQVSFTPQQKGPVRARVMLGKASATVYVNPVVSIA